MAVRVERCRVLVLATGPVLPRGVPTCRDLVNEEASDSLGVEVPPGNLGLTYAWVRVLPHLWGVDSLSIVDRREKRAVQLHHGTIAPALRSAQILGDGSP